MALFENLTFQAIINQTVEPDFWVIVVDGELPSKFRLRLEELTAAYDWIVVHRWNPTCDWYQLGWVIDLFSIETPFVLTSLIDDDDALDLNYNERLRNQVDNHIRVGSRFGWFWFGSLCALEWDLDFRRLSSVLPSHSLAAQITGKGWALRFSFLWRQMPQRPTLGRTL